MPPYEIVEADPETDPIYEVAEDSALGKRHMPVTSFPFLGMRCICMSLRACPDIATSCDAVALRRPPLERTTSSTKI